VMSKDIEPKGTSTANKPFVNKFSWPREGCQERPPDRL
jgi:hypothetical protein